MTLVVIALGGNALLRRGEPLDAAVQRANVKLAAEAVAAVAYDHDVVLTHGNGPQVGLLALQNEAYRETAAYPLDVLDAESEGMVGYLLEEALAAHLPPELLATLLTQVVVDADDPAFDTPTKPVGPMYDEASARAMAAARGWTIARDGTGWRRVVPSPEPRRILELAAIRLLVGNGILVTCVGGGGIPVIEHDGGRRGVEAVIDKDLASALLATELRADALILLTDVDGVYEGWGTDEARLLPTLRPSDIDGLTLAAGSIAPKVLAARRFVEAGGAFAAIGRLEDAPELATGRCGTVIRAGG